MSHAPSVCILQYDDRFGTADGERALGWQQVLADRTRAACENDERCTYVRRDATDDDLSPSAQRPVYWRKVQHVRDLVGSDQHDCDYVMWMDADAAMATTPSELVRVAADWAPPSADFIGAGDNEAMAWHARFNAGVFLVRRNKGGQDIVNRWDDEWHSVKDSWREDENGKWHTDATWAGDKYEQGAFRTKLLDEPNVAMVDWCAFQRNDAPGEAKACEAVPHLTSHFAVETKDRIPEFLERQDARKWVR